MKYVLWILLGLAGLALVFVVLPTIVSYFAAFRRRKGRSFDELDFTGTPYEPYIAQISKEIAYFKAKEMERMTVATSLMEFPPSKSPIISLANTPANRKQIKKEAIENIMIAFEAI